MKIATIICEFNPIHTGHKKLIDYAKSVADKVICIMSGNFVQRGMPACADKYDRARHAVMCGADMVVELPTVYATAPANNFATGGVRLASQLGADILVFGSECGDIDALRKVSKKLLDKGTNETICNYLAEGYSYPKAVSLAVNSPLLDTPNNILAIEYLTAIDRYAPNIVPLTIKRENNYNGDGVEFASSSQLRKDKSLREQFSFEFVAADIDDYIEDKYKQFVCHYLTTLSADSLRAISGVSEGIENRIVSAVKHHGYEVMMEQIKTKRFTRARLQRIILNSILHITDDTQKAAATNDIPTKVLAIKGNSTTLLQRCNDLDLDSHNKIADGLYLSLSGKQAPTKLQKID